MRGIVRALAAFMLFVLAPSVVYAQATLAGIARDTSGAVLPGVTVEAASPVLIEKVRTATTDGTGRYTIPDLRPGTYTVTFSLTGFRTVVRDGVELSGTAVRHDQRRPGGRRRAGNDHGLRRDAGRRPAVDDATGGHGSGDRVGDSELAHAVHRRRADSRACSKGAFTGQDVGGSVVQEVASLEANGGRTSDQRMMVNGVALSSGIAGGWGGGAVPNATGTAEFAIDVSGVDAQAATGGVRINFIPRDGGNRFSGTIAGSYANEDLASDNFTGSDVQQRGLAVPGTIKANGDFNPGFGGPIKRDKLWFFLSGRIALRRQLRREHVLQPEREQAGPLRLRAVDRPGDPPSGADDLPGAAHVAGDAEAQVRHHLRPGELLRVHDRHRPGTGGAVTSPEAGNDRRFPLQRFVTVDWSTPVSNRLLIEASGIHRVERWGGMEPQVGKLGNIDHLEPGMISVTDTPQPGHRHGR